MTAVMQGPEGAAWSIFEAWELAQQGYVDNLSRGTNFDKMQIVNQLLPAR